MIHPELLGRYRLFQNLKLEELAQIAPMLRIVEIEKGETVFEQFHPHTGPYLVYSGKIKYCFRSPGGREVILAIFGPGESFEDISLFFEFHGSTAVALEDCILYNIPREKLIDVLSKQPRIALEYFRNLTHSMLKLRFGVVNVLLNDAERKLSTYLMSLVPQTSKQTAKVTLPEKKHLIAAYLGMSAETFSRTLRALKAAGYIKTEGQTIILKNVEALQKKAVKI